jgi:hypothetical protein
VDEIHISAATDGSFEGRLNELTVFLSAFSRLDLSEMPSGLVLVLDDVPEHDDSLLCHSHLRAHLIEWITEPARRAAAELERQAQVRLDTQMEGKTLATWSQFVRGAEVDPSRRSIICGITFRARPADRVCRSAQQILSRSFGRSHRDVGAGGLAVLTAGLVHDAVLSR